MTDKSKETMNIIYQWITPLLIALVGFFAQLQLSDIRSELKELKVANMEAKAATAAMLRDIHYIQRKIDEHERTITEREVVELTDRVKTCVHCGQRFRYFNSKAKYCTDACRIAAWEQRTGRAWKGGRGA